MNRCSIIKFNLNFQAINAIYNRVFSPRKWMPSVPLPKIDLNSSTLSIGNVTLNYIRNETLGENVVNGYLCLLATQMELLEKVFYFSN